MISVQRTKEILADAHLSDAEIEAIRDSFRDLTEIIFESMKQEKPDNLISRTNDYDT